MNIDFPTLVTLIVKILVLLGLGVYAVFAVVIVRQENLMAHVVEESFEPVLRLLVYIHLLAAVALIALAFILL